MKKPRYYYTENITTDTLNVKCVDGEPLYIVNKIKSKRSPRLTICGIWDTEDNTMSFGYTRCSPNDIFKKAIGREIAYERALSNPCLVKAIGDQKVPDVFMETCLELDNSFVFNI